MRDPRPKEKILRAVRPNAGIEAAYRKKLYALIDEMQASVAYWLESAYRNNQPRIMAEDETPAEALQRAVRKLTARWTKRFDSMSEKMADWFAQSVEKRSTAALKKILRDGGFAVEFKMTPAMRDVLGATVNANVTLIKSIPEKYMNDVAAAVMRSVQTGRDLSTLTEDLQKHYGVTKRRAKFIALDQSNKATAALSAARKLEVGLDEEIWVHSGGGKEPRPTHAKAGRERIRYKISQGWYDPAVKQYIRPGELPGCRCIGRPVVKGFS